MKSHQSIVLLISLIYRCSFTIRESGKLHKLEAAMSNANLKMPHEEFTANTETKSNGRRLVIRPDRIQLESEKCFLEINKHKYSVVDVSPFGIAIESETPIDEDIKNIVKAKILYDYVEVAQLTLKRVRNLNLTNNKLQYAFEVIGEPLKLDRLVAVRDSFKIINSQENEFDNYSKVPDEFKILVYQMKDWLEKLENKIDHLEKDNEWIRDKSEIVQVIPQVISSYFKEMFIPTYKKLSNSLSDSNEEAVSLSFDFFREHLNKLIQKAPFADRVYNKPLGYAGDFEMMNIIYRGKAQGASLFAQCLHKYFVDEPAAAAVRNRSKYLLKKILNHIERKKGEPLKIMSVASGPAREIQLLVELHSDLLSDKIEIYLVDQDVDALKHAQFKLRNLTSTHNTNVKIKYINSAIKNIIAKGLDEGGFDLIYSAGLFDYLSAPVAEVTANRLHKSLSENGELIIGNFSVSNPNQFTMNLALDWQLLYRSKEDMEQIFNFIDKNVTIEEESLGINLFAIAKK